MVWQGTTTWGAGPWVFDDANKYIRDNLNSVRRYQTSINAWNDSCVATTTSSVQGNHSGVATSTPDEGYNMIVMVNGHIDNPSGGCTGVFVQVADSLANTIGPLMFYTCTATASQSVAFCLGGVKGYPAGFNPGFHLNVLANPSGTALMSWTSMVILSPFA